MHAELSRLLDDLNPAQRDAVTVARALLGQRLVRVLDGQRLAGVIVETELGKYFKSGDYTLTLSLVDGYAAGAKPIIATRRVAARRGF